jgi:O-antigen/teichoic acid export membrane protein
LKPLSYTRDFFTKGHERSLMAKRNIAGTLLIKGCSVLISLILVPLVINYINPAQFGIWLTLSSFLTWFAFFDIGFGNGLKNKLSEALAIGNLKLARIYVSTTYFMLLLISALLLVIFLIIHFFLDWTRLLNAPSNLAKEISVLVLIIFSMFSFQFVLQLINIVAAAKQNAIIPALIGFLGSLLSLIVIFVLSKTTAGSLVYVGIASASSPVIILLLFSIFLYKGAYRKIRPTLKFVQMHHLKDLMALGIKFFFIQIGLLFLYNTDNLIISHVLSPAAVTSFHIAFKYFSVITMICAIVMAPLWPAFTEANAKGDLIWIKHSVGRLLKFCTLMLVMGFFMLLLSDRAYRFWVGSQVEIPFTLSFVLFLFTVLNAYRTIFSFYFNGTGKIMLQLYLVVSSGLINIPLSIYLGKLMGSTGVILATTILCALCAVVETIQYYKLINQQATGIWNK